METSTLVYQRKLKNLIAALTLCLPQFDPQAYAGWSVGHC
jgi:hypothetical protein